MIFYLQLINNYIFFLYKENHVYAWGSRKDGRLGIDSALLEGSATATPKPIFGTLYKVNDMSSRHWHSIIIAEKILNQRAVRNFSYCDALRKEKNSSIENLEEAATNQARIPFNPDLINIARYDKEESTLPVRHFNFNQNFPENFNVLPNEETNHMPTWLRNDVNNAEFIPIEALNKDLQKSTSMTDHVPIWLKNEIADAEFIPIDRFVKENLSNNIHKQNPLQNFQESNSINVNLIQLRCLERVYYFIGHILSYKLTMVKYFLAWSIKQKKYILQDSKEL